MRDFMKRSGLVGVVLCLFLTGCGEELWTMTPEEESLIVAYASGAVAKNNKYQVQGLTYYEEQEPEEPEPEPEQEPQDTYQEEGQQPTEGSVQEPGQADEMNQGGVSASLADAAGLSPVTAEYHGYQLMDKYMEGNYFALAAQPGNQLVVLSIGLFNPTQQPVECNNIARNIRCTLLINGQAQSDAMPTALLNDFISYLNTLQAGETQETVLFFEVPAEAAGNIQSLALELEADSVVYHVNLQQ